MSIGFWQIAIVVILVVLLFGRGKISSLMGDVAKGIKSFKKGMASDVLKIIRIKMFLKKIKTQKIVINPMPQIGWLEILIIVSIAIIVIGPKDFPIMLKKVGSWIGSVKRYISNVQNEVASIEDDAKNIYDNEIKKEKKKYSKKKRCLKKKMVL